MVKLIASYGLKVPGAQEYSSQSFHATAEVELADALVNKPDAMKAALHSLWGDLKVAVAEQIQRGQPAPARSSNGNGRTNGNGHHRNQDASGRSSRDGNGASASKKQIGFLLSLTRRKRNLSAEQTRDWLLSERGLRLNALSKSEAGTLIDELNDN